eukprot:8309273-Ditylum_brightwellii.AAC.1
MCKEDEGVKIASKTCISAIKSISGEDEIASISNCLHNHAMNIDDIVDTFNINNKEVEEATRNV